MHKKRGCKSVKLHKKSPQNWSENRYAFLYIWFSYPFFFFSYGILWFLNFLHIEKTRRKEITSLFTYFFSLFSDFNQNPKAPHPSITLPTLLLAVVVLTERGLHEHWRLVHERRILLAPTTALFLWNQESTWISNYFNSICLSASHRETPCPIWHAWPRRLLLTVHCNIWCCSGIICSVVDIIWLPSTTPFPSIRIFTIFTTSSLSNATTILIIRMLFPLYPISN